MVKKFFWSDYSLTLKMTFKVGHSTPKIAIFWKMCFFVNFFWHVYFLVFCFEFFRMNVKPLSLLMTGGRFRFWWSRTNQGRPAALPNFQKRQLLLQPNENSQEKFLPTQFSTFWDLQNETKKNFFGPSCWPPGPICDFYIMCLIGQTLSNMWNITIFINFIIYTWLTIAYEQFLKISALW